jgi:ketosteroid isomerase-like protein
VETIEMREEDDRVLHALNQFAKARGSEAEIQGELYMVWWFRDGKAVRMEMYNTREQAEEAFAR